MCTGAGSWPVRLERRTTLSSMHHRTCEDSRVESGVGIEHLRISKKISTYSQIRQKCICFGRNRFRVGVRSCGAYRTYQLFAQVYTKRNSLISLGHGDRCATLLAATLEVFVGLEVELFKLRAKAQGVRRGLRLACDRRANINDDERIKSFRLKFTISESQRYSH